MQVFVPIMSSLPTQTGYSKLQQGKGKTQVNALARHMRSEMAKLDWRTVVQ